MKNKIIPKILLFVLTAVLITVMLPNHGVFKYDFKRGGTWQYETLKAPFDFPLHKSTKELYENSKELDKTFLPVFVRDSAKAGYHLELFYMDAGLSERIVDSVNRLLSRKPNVRLDEKGINVLLYEQLRKLYAKGIYNPAEKDYVNRDASGEYFIRLVSGNDMFTVSLSTLTDIPAAKASLEAVAKTHSDGIPSTRLDRIFEKYVAANILYDDYLSKQAKQRERHEISGTRGIIAAGTTLVQKNQLIDDDVYQTLESLRMEYNARIGPQGDFWWIILGQFLFVAIILFSSYAFFYYFRKEFFGSLQKLSFILFLYLLMAGLTALVLQVPVLNLYLIPYAVIPLYIMVFFDVRFSVFEYVSILLICSMMAPFPFDFFFLNFTAGISGILVLRNSYSRNRIFSTVGAILITYIAGYFALSLIHNGDVSTFYWPAILWFVLNALLLIAMYQLVYPFEKIFGFVTNITLLELSDTNQKLLLELSQKAPGTFQHSVQVANLAEAAAKAIDANPLLARTGALYHDIGKIYNPVYFIENVSNDFNPHDRLEPSESASIIRHHVTEGVKLGKKERLPNVILQFIESHHGDSRIFYFYAKEKEKCGQVEDDSSFRYPGPKPVGKEVSICMMADAVEAASRSLPDYSAENVSELVDKIIDDQIRDDYFANSELKFREIAVIKNVFVRKISKMYHTRIVYPERD